jgi:hypothetical protein
MEEVNRKCPACGSRELLPGMWERHWFTPPWHKRKLITVGEAYGTRRFICLQCGLASEYLPQEELVVLRANAEKHKGIG